MFDFDYGSTLDSIEKKFKLTANMTDRFEHAMSTGLLVYDLILGGGLVTGGMYTFSGMEQTAKSTTILRFLGNSLDLGVDQRPKMTLYIDGEGSFSPDYFATMIKSSLSDTEIFGVKDKTGAYTVKPRVRYYPENRGELVLDAMNALLRRLPDKELLDGQWYYVFENTRDNQKLVKGEYVKGLFSKFNKFYIPTSNTSPQAIIVVDSWPSLITERGDDEDANEGLGAQARMFSEYIPRIKGKLRRKGAILLGVNQLREKPMARGNPLYEPCGNSLKFYSDVRLWNTSRAIPHASGQLEEEASATGKGVDTYRYIHTKAVKNKLSTPYLDGWSRLWVSDAEGVARGFCPVWDVFTYMKMTGQVTGTMKKMSLNVGKIDIPKMTFMDLKSLVLLKGKELKGYCVQMGLKSNPKLRDVCFGQIRSGAGSEMYYANLRVGSTDDESFEEEE